MLTVRSYYADGRLSGEHKVTRIERHPPGFVKTAIKLHLDNGTEVVFKDMATLRKSLGIEKGAIQK